MSGKTLCKALNDSSDGCSSWVLDRGWSVRGAEQLFPLVKATVRLSMYLYLEEKKTNAMMT